MSRYVFTFYSPYKFDLCCIKVADLIVIIILKKMRMHQSKSLYAYSLYSRRLNLGTESQFSLWLSVSNALLIIFYLFFSFLPLFDLKAWFILGIRNRFSNLLKIYYLAPAALNIALSVLTYCQH